MSYYTSDDNSSLKKEVPVQRSLSPNEADKGQRTEEDFFFLPQKPGASESLLKTEDKMHLSSGKGKGRRQRPVNYGTIGKEPPYRSTSMPVRRREKVFIARRPAKMRTIGEQSAKLAEEAKRNFFHGSFTSSHGAMFLVPPKRRNSLTWSTHSRSASRGSHKGSCSPRGRGKTVGGRQKGAEDANSPGDDAKDATMTGNQREEADGGSFFSAPLVLLPRSHSADLNTRTYEVVGKGKFPTHERHPIEFGDDITSLQDADTDEGKKDLLGPVSNEEDVRPFEQRYHEYLRHPEKGFFTTEDPAILQEITPLFRTPESASHNLNKPPKRVQISSVLEEVGRAHGRHSKTDWKQVRRFSPECEVEQGTSGEKKEYTEEEDGEAEEDEEESGEDVISYGEAFMEMLRLAAPAAVSICFTFCMSVVPLAFVGNILGDRQLTGASVGYFIISIFILYPIIGLTFAMDTLCSHEYGRDPLSSGQGLLLQRGVLINLVVLIPLFFWISRLHGILMWIYGVNVASVASEFLTFAPIFLLPIMLFIGFTKFLINQMQAQMPMIALTAGIIVTPLVQLQLTPFGVKYTMVGMAITAWFQLGILVFMTLFKPETRQTLGTLRLREAFSFEEVKAYLELAIPSAIFVAAEASSFDVTVLLVAKFGEHDGAAWSSIMNTLFIFASLSGGLSASACANIGRCIGANQPISARRFVFVSIFTAFTLSLVDSVALLVFFDNFMALFGAAGQTLAIARHALFLLPFLHVADAVQFAFQGIFSGLGKNHIGAFILLVSLWGIGIPLAFLLGDYLGYGLFGSCLGLTIGLCIEAPCMVIYSFHINYDEVCEKFFADMDDEEDEELLEDNDDDEEDDEDEEEESYVMDEDVLRRSGISTRRAEFEKCYSEGYEAKILLPPSRRPGQ